VCVCAVLSGSWYVTLESAAIAAPSVPSNGPRWFLTGLPVLVDALTATDECKHEDLSEIVFEPPFTVLRKSIQSQSIRRETTLHVVATWELYGKLSVSVAFFFINFVRAISCSRTACPRGSRHPWDVCLRARTVGTDRRIELVESWIWTFQHDNERGSSFAYFVQWQLNGDFQNNDGNFR